MDLMRWFFQDEQERQFFLDVSLRLQSYNRRAMSVLALSLIVVAPWLSPWSIVPIIASAATVTLAEHLVIRKRQLGWIFAAWPVSQGLTSVAIAMNHAGQTPNVGLLLFALAGASIGFPRRYAGFCCGYTAVLIELLVVLTDPARAIAFPQMLTVAPAAAVATTILAGAGRSASVAHQRLAMTDVLTGMLNRSALEGRATTLACQAGQLGQRIGVIVMDLDHFKRVNDRYGHVVGDQVLAETAQRLQTELRVTDTAYRVGGEEFVLLLPGTHGPQLLATAERLRARISATPIAGVDVTASFGVCAAQVDDRFDYDATFAAADAALYDAKRAGRDRVQMTTWAPASSPAAAVAMRTGG